MKAKKHVVIDLYGMEGYGSTKAEAKADAEQKLQRATDGFYSPRLYRFHSEYIGLVYRNLNGWHYTYLRPDNTNADFYSVGPFQTPGETERKLRAHIAQNLIFVTDDNGSSVILDERDQLEHTEYVAWQLRYKEYRAQGYNESDCHRMAYESWAPCPPAA